MASIFGLIRKAIGAKVFRRLASASILNNSDVDSTLKQPMWANKADLISSQVLPTPENTVFFASPPAKRTRSNSPPDTMSKPAPHCAKSAKIVRLALAFTA